MKAIDLLNASYDRKLNQEEQQFLKDALASDPSLRKEKEHLDQLWTLMAAQKTSLKQSLAEHIMAEIEQPVEETVDINKGLIRWFPKVVAACILVIMAMLTQIYVQHGSLDTDTLMGVQDLELYDAYSLTEEEFN